MNTDIVVLDGSCTLVSHLDGRCALSNQLDGNSIAVLKVREVDYYTGSYEFTPSANTQVIEIDQLTASQNITINPIPSNYGLITWNGSTLTVS